MEMAGTVGVVGHRIPQPQPVGWEAEISQSSPHAPCARLCVGLFDFPAFLSFHSPWQACWGGGQEEVPEGSVEEPNSEKEGMGSHGGHSSVSHRKGTWGQLHKQDQEAVNKGIYVHTGAQLGWGGEPRGFRLS